MLLRYDVYSELQIFISKISEIELLQDFSFDSLPSALKFALSAEKIRLLV